MARDQLTPQQIEAGVSQMKINTRLTALQSASVLMGHKDYNGVADANALITISKAIEEFIIGDLVKEANDAVAKMRNPGPTIVRP